MSGEIQGSCRLMSSLNVRVIPAKGILSRSSLLSEAVRAPGIPDVPVLLFLHSSFHSLKLVAVGIFARCLARPEMNKNLMNLRTYSHSINYKLTQAVRF